MEEEKKNENSFLFTQHLWHSIEIQTQLGLPMNVMLSTLHKQWLFICLNLRIKILNFSTNELSSLKCAEKENYVNNSNQREPFKMS